MASIESPDIPAIKERVLNTRDGLLIGLVECNQWNAKRPLPE